MLIACMSNGLKIQFLSTFLTLTKLHSKSIIFGKINSIKIGFSKLEDVLKL